jgi:GH24 family phage-related lysozyme (muramidase)
LRLTSYPDASSTTKDPRFDIGYGHWIQKGEGIGSEITPQRAEMLFQQDYAKASGQVAKQLGNTQVPDIARAVLNDVAFQHGSVPEPMMQAVRNGDWDKAADLLQTYDKVRTGQIPALTSRFGLQAQVLRQLGGGGGTNVAAAARAGGTDSSGQPATTSGAAPTARTKPSAAIPAGQIGRAREAISKAFGTDADTNPNTYLTPETQYPEEGSSSGDDYAAQNQADEVASRSAAADAAPE